MAGTPGVLHQTTPTPTPTPTPAAGTAEVPKLMSATCTALFDFVGQDADELTFKVGDRLVITGELNEWWANGK
jgi:hypothetical protein